MSQGSSSSGSTPAEQYESPLSAQGMVDLATSLLAHPRGLSLRKKIHQTAWGSGLRFNRDAMLEEVEKLVRAMCPHLAQACATGLTLALLPLAAWKVKNCRLTVKCDHASEEAVAAFYEALGQPTCAVKSLTIKGDAFGTPAAARHLGRFLNRNPSLRNLSIHYVAHFCSRDVWTNFSDALTSNATLRQLWLTGNSYGQGDGTHVGATLANKMFALREVRIGGWETPTQATLEDMNGFGTMLRQNSTVINLLLNFWLSAGDGLFVPICEAINNTGSILEKLVVGSSGMPQQPWDFYVEQEVASSEVGSNDEHISMEEVASSDSDASSDADADAVSMAAMLFTNISLRDLDIMCSGIACNAAVFDEGLSHNNTLQELAISVDAAGARALMAALARVDGTSSCISPQLKSLTLGRQHGESSLRFPSADALRDMLASNTTLTELYLGFAPYSKEQWATTILPALAGNHSLQKLDFRMCRGMSDGLVYDAVSELLDSNTSITNICLPDTPLDIVGKVELVQARLNANKAYRAALMNVPTMSQEACECYPNQNVEKGEKRGLAVIISMEKYKSGDRPGGSVDRENLKALAEILDFDFEDHVMVDYTAAKVSETLRTITEEKILAGHESFLCFVNGHGDSTHGEIEDHFFNDPDGDMLFLDTIVNPFRNCKHLQGKPKVFFVNSCRGTNKPLVGEQQLQPTCQQLPREAIEHKYVQEIKDCLIVFSTSGRSVSTRDTQVGTSFVRALKNAFTNKRKTLDVLGVVCCATNEVAAEEHKVPEDVAIFGQCPVYVSSLTKLLYWS